MTCWIGVGVVVDGILDRMAFEEGDHQPDGSVRHQITPAVISRTKITLDDLVATYSADDWTHRCRSIARELDPSAVAAPKIAVALASAPDRASICIRSDGVWVTAAELMSTYCLTSSAP